MKKWKLSDQNRPALEARESVNEEESKLRGVSVDEHYEEETDIRITKVTIDTKNAEKTLGKPMGVYVTMEHRPWWNRMTITTGRSRRR